MRISSTPQAGGGKIAITIDSNPNIASRTGTLLVTGEGFIHKVRVVQGSHDQDDDDDDEEEDDDEDEDKGDKDDEDEDKRR